MHDPADDARQRADDVKTLHALGYAQELLRGMSGFSNFAISMSIICIVAGGLTSLHLGLSGVGGAAVGLGWPLVGLFSLAVAATMGQVASAFPTAGGLYHWASILGGRGWGWATAWFNLAGLVTILTSINVGTFLFLVRPAGAVFGYDPDAADPGTRAAVQLAAVALMTASQALVNHLGIRATTRLTDFSGYLIMVMAAALTVAALAFAAEWDFGRLVTFANYSGPAGDNVWPATASTAWLFALGLLLPAYTITGFDASAHTAEETVGAAAQVPRGIVRSVLVSGVFGWVMLGALVLAIPDMGEAAGQGEKVFHWLMGRVFPAWLAGGLYLGIGVAQYLCGLAALTSASRMTFAFARDRGLPFSAALHHVSPTYRTPPAAIWAVAAAAVAFAAYTPVFSTIVTVCTVFLYISYVLPTAAGFVAHGRTWTAMGPWHLGRWYRPLAVVSVAGCVGLIVIGVQPPNDQALTVVGGAAVVLAVAWVAVERRRFPGPPRGVMLRHRRAEIEAAERDVGEVAVPNRKETP
jgi:amino acid transporter